ncbi:MAG: hypothetical protein ACFE0O_09065 [Opitutales bacterium]
MLAVFGHQNDALLRDGEKQLARRLDAPYMRDIRHRDYARPQVEPMDDPAVTEQQHSVLYRERLQGQAEKVRQPHRLGFGPDKER